MARRAKLGRPVLPRSSRLRGLHAKQVDRRKRTGRMQQVSRITLAGRKLVQAANSASHREEFARLPRSSRNLNRADARRQQNKPSPHLRQSVLRAETALVRYCVPKPDQCINKMPEYFCADNAGDILHRDHLWHGLSHEATELIKQRPLIIARGVSTPAVRRERLAGRTAGQYPHRAGQPETVKLISGDCPHVLLEELGLDVALEGIPAPRVVVKASDYSDPRADEAMRQPSCAAEQVNCTNTYVSNCHTSNLAEIRPDVDQQATSFLVHVADIAGHARHSRQWPLCPGR